MPRCASTVIENPQLFTPVRSFQLSVGHDGHVYVSLGGTGVVVGDPPPPDPTAVPDSLPPTTPTGVTATIDSLTQATLTWPASTDKR